MCEWEDHAEHDDEDNVFYAPIVAYVTDRGRLVSSPFRFILLVTMKFIDIYSAIDVNTEYVDVS